MQNNHITIDRLGEYLSMSIDLIIFVGFLILNLGVGLMYGRKVVTIEDYALGGRKFTTTALVSTIVATWVTGSLFLSGMQGAYQEDGILELIGLLCMPINIMIVSLVFIPRMGSFMGKLSSAHVMGDIYGKCIRFITALGNIIKDIGFVAVQLKVFGGVINYFFSMSETMAIIIAAGIVLIYSAFGGIRAVTFTDVMQFSVFTFILPILGIIIWFNHDFSGIFTPVAGDSHVFISIFNIDRPTLIDTLLLCVVRLLKMPMCAYYICL
ncbi:MAG: hypothetical protein AB8B66_05040 [Rickettsiaceae bacterium]